MPTFQLQALRSHIRDSWPVCGLCAEVHCFHMNVSASEGFPHFAAPCFSTLVLWEEQVRAFFYQKQHFSRFFELLLGLAYTQTFYDEIC